MLSGSVNVFILYISCCSYPAFIQIAFAADMYYLIAGQKPGKDIADRCIYGYRAQTSAYDKKYRFAGRQVGISEPGQPVTLE